jgi:hypothetical protein
LKNAGAGRGGRRRGVHLRRQFILPPQATVAAAF